MNEAKNSDIILAQLKREGAMTANELAQVLAITSMGARQHLLRLEQQHLVDKFSQKATMGRPKQYWQLTDIGHARFPDHHADLTLHIIDSVRTLYGESALDKVIQSREASIEKHYGELLASSEGLLARLTVLAQQRNREGYMASIEQIDVNEYLLIENHCPICAAAKRCQGFCRSELQIFQRCLGEQYLVERAEYLLAGDRRCVYRIKNK